MVLPVTPVRFLLHYVASRPLGFVALAAAVIGGSASAVGVQYAMKLLVDAMTVAPRMVREVQLAVVLFVALVAVESLLLRLSAVLLCRTTTSTGVRIRLDMFHHLSGHQLPFFQNQRVGALGQRVSGLPGIFGALVHRLLLEVAPPVIAFVGALAIFVTIDPGMAAALGVAFFLITGALVTFGLRGDVHHKDFVRQAGRSGGELVDLLGNMWAVKAFAARGRELLRLGGFFEEEAAAQRRGWHFVERVRGLFDAALALLVGATLFWAIGRWSRGAISTGDVVVVSAMTFRMLHGARDLAMALVDTSQQFSYLGETLDLVGVPHGVADAPEARALHAAAGAIRLDAVSFGYDAHHPVLHDLSLTIPAGQRVGIVGPSGAGKSTILQLVQRLHDPQAGRVLVDGQPIDMVTQDSLRQAVAVVPQEVLLFHRSVMENIRFARPEASDEDVCRAAKAAGCDAFIRCLPQGYATVVGERGTNLSGGQRQRIGIARAFLKDAPILLLDEATAALDTRAEREVQEGLDALMAGRTVLAVAHRLSTIAAFDRVLVVEGGRVVEDGDPAVLLRTGGAFRRLWAMQAEGFDEPAGTAPARAPHAAPWWIRPHISAAAPRLAVASLRERTREQG